ncbi:MAG: hypothetical protein C4547_08510 [Phycisphaerales bacterium]|nr:MAG: hypothetical protein C4547_08510 [Phycisphaerales bacterium]
MPADEQVLVIERRVFEQAGAFQGITFDTRGYLDRFFVEGVPRFVPRAAAEDDPSLKQLIPYVVLSCGGRVLSYVRGSRAGEKRLVGQRSIGIGGHINPTDDLPLFADPRQTYLAAVEREVAEEICVESPHTDRIAALINDDDSAVGRVHLGIVHHWRLETPAVRKREQMITRMAFLTLDELRAVRDTMETWSSICLDHVHELLGGEHEAAARPSAASTHPAQ